MPGFCVSCGTPLTGTFCNQCGARAVAANAPVAQAAASTPASPLQPASASAAGTAAKGTGLGKVLAIVGGVFVLLFVIGVGAAVYGVYWVKHKVTAYSAAVTGRSSEPTKVVSQGDSCRLLSTAELEELIGVTVEKSAEIMEGSSPGCAYYTNPEAFAKLQRMAAEFARRQTEEVNSRPGPKPDNFAGLLKNTNELEGVVKTLALTQPVEDGQVFSFTVDRNAGSGAWTAARLVEAAVPGFEEVKGVGDRAMIGSFGHAFFVQKGDAVISLNTTWVPDARARGPEISKKIMGHL
jgi:hypothetical protein